MNGDGRERSRSERQGAFAEADLYPVTGAAQSAGRSTLAVVEAVIAAGCRVVQLREKELCRREYYHLARRVRQLTEAQGVLLICNDHVDVALAVGADGVHLGQQDLPIGAARRLAPELLLGASTHNMQEALAAQRAGADYVNIGPIFPTRTKEGATCFLGPEAVEQIGGCLKVPFTVMGGITLDNVEELLARGARRLAVVSAVTAAPDVEAAARALRERIRSHQRRSAF
jgi:thiamine-phosphate pyrophosphorylase